MEDEWIQTSVGEITDRVTKGTTPTTLGARFVEHGISFVKVESITEDGRILPDKLAHIDSATDALLPRSRLQQDDILFTIAGTIGRADLVPSWLLPANTNQAVAIVRPKRGVIDPGFLFYVLRDKSRVKHAQTRVVQSVQANFSLGELSSLEIPLPPLAEQKAIAAVLGSLDEKIELNRRMNATLEAMARTLFQSWFVDFDPIRAKLDGRQLGDLDPGTAGLFPDSFQASELGHIPTGWKVTTLGACIGFRSGFSFKSQDWQESGVPVVKIGSVKPGIIDLSQVSYVSEEIAHQAARYRLSTGDMLIGMTGYVGEVDFVPPSTNPPLLNQRVGKFVMPKAGTESLAFWYCTTRQPEFRAFVEARSHGTAQANVSGDAIMQFPLVAPVPEILDAFNRECQPMLDRILSNHAESCTLATLRDTLLPKLLSGELRPTQSCPTGETLCQTT